MHHFFVAPLQEGAEIVRITGSDVNHIRRVLRIKPGENILVSDNTGNDYVCRVERLEEEQVTAAVVLRQERGRELPARIHLYQGLPKADKMEWVIQKAVELGVFRVVPVTTRFTVVRLDRKKEESRVKRWQAIAESAAKQSKRSLVPEVAPVMGLKEALEDSADFGARMIPYEQAEGMDGLRAQLELVRPGLDLAVYIGPEGGFDAEEVRLALEAGVRPVSLGRRILRTETAGLVILSALMLRLEAGWVL